MKTDEILAQFQCRWLRQDRWLRVLKIRLIFRRITWSDSKDSKYRNYNSTSSLIPHHFWCGKEASKHRSQVVLMFRRNLCDAQRSADFWFFGWAKILTIGAWKRFSKFWDAGRLWTRSSIIPIWKRRSASRSRKPRKRTAFYEEDRSPSWSTFEWLVLMTQYWIMLIYSLLLNVMTTFRNSIRDGTKFCCRWQ